MASNQMKDEDAARLRTENQILRHTITQMEIRISELEQLADTDTLTPLPNRRAFLRRLEAVIGYCARHGTPAAIVFVDLDGLKRINDEYGHAAGDAVLRHVATQLSASLRGSDMVARIGGDEFGLILDHLNETDASAKAFSLTEQIAADKVNLGCTRINVTITAGIAVVRPGDTVDGLITRADDAMYAKRLHRSQT